MEKDSEILVTRRAFGVLFIAVSIAVGVATILSEIAFLYKAPLYYYAIIWLLSVISTCGIVFGVLKFHKLLPLIKSRMKNSVRWPTYAKGINGLCWAGPFAIIPLFPHSYQYLILLGIGLGNTSTYILMKKYSMIDNREQMIVGLISLAAFFASLGVDTSLFITRQDMAITTSRILISIAYGCGGAYALAASTTSNAI